MTTHATIQDYVDSRYRATREIVLFAEQMIMPVLGNTINPNSREFAIIGTYYRAYALGQSIVKLNSRIHLQAIAAAARTMFECLIDIRTIEADSTGEQVERFHAFPSVTKFLQATRVVSFYDDHPDLEPDAYFDVEKKRRKVVGGPEKQKRVTDDVVRLWGRSKKSGKPQWPDHWTGKNLRERARDLGHQYEQLYLDFYAFGSWYVHAGATAYAGLEASLFDGVVGLSHDLAHRCLVETTDVCARELHLMKGIEGLRTMLEKLSDAPSRFFLERHLEKEQQKLQEGTKA